MAMVFAGVNILCAFKPESFSTPSPALEERCPACHLPAMAKRGDDGKRESGKNPSGDKTSREERLAEALRQNLRRRKAKKD